MVSSAVLEKGIQGIHRLVIGFVCASLVVGQGIRFTVSGQGGGLLVSDIAVVLFLLVAALLWGFTLPARRRSVSGGGRELPLLTISPFLIWSLTTLMLHSSQLGHSEMLVALLYWARLTSILLLYPAGALLLRGEKVRNFAKKACIYAYVAMLVFGFLQLFIFPNVEIFGNNWDPHMGRMVGTWLDPNFFGAFLALLLPTIVFWIPSRVMQVCIVCLSLIAILLTRSRSTYIALFIALCVCCIVWLFTSPFPEKWKKMVVPGIVTIAIFILFSGIILGERASRIFIHDPTVAIRVEAYQEVWKRLVVPNIFFGVGYNAYQVAAKDAGLITDYQIHSRAGSDSSILTLLVTTGLVGTALFFIPLFLGLIRHYSLVYIWITVFLLVHSLFVNSLLYPHILISSILVILLASR